MLLKLPVSRCGASDFLVEFLEYGKSISLINYIDRIQNKVYAKKKQSQTKVVKVLENRAVTSIQFLYIENLQPHPEYKNRFQQIEVS